MTTYSYNLSLDDSESIALANALKCYLSPEVQAFLAANPSIGTWGNTTLIRDILEINCTQKWNLLVQIIFI